MRHMLHTWQIQTHSFSFSFLSFFTLSRPSCSQTFPYCSRNSSFLNMVCNEQTTLGPRSRHTLCVKSQDNNTFPSEVADASKCQAESVIMWRKLTLGFQSCSDKINRLTPPPPTPYFVEDRELAGCQAHAEQFLRIKDFAAIRRSSVLQRPTFRRKMICILL